MLNRFFGTNFHNTVHLFGISVLAVGLPTSKVILSLGTMLILLNVILEGSYKSYWQRIKSNHLFILVALFWILHIVALLWTEDFQYASNDIRIKLTLIVIPLVLTIKPLKDSTQLLLVLGLFISTLTLTSLINIASYEHWIGTKEYTDIRELSLFGSHIRYGILIAFGAGVSLFYLYTLRSVSKWIFLPLLIWFSYYTYYSQIISGLVALIVVYLVFLVFIAYQRSKVLGLVSVLISIGIIVLPLLLLFTDKKDNTVYEPDKMDKYTASGNPYVHDLNERSFIDGKPVFIYVSEVELQKEWTKKSIIPYDSLDKKQQELRYTLIRYMNSKGLRKDSVDFQKLSNQDIHNIENGMANFEETKIGLIARIEGIKLQLYHSGNPNGHSLLQRLEFWKTGIHIIQKNWLIGVGTGDVQKAFDEQYILDSSKLLPENRLRAHNSYLTSWISFGVTGFLLFIWILISFVGYHWKNQSLLPLMFIFIAISTFFIEDTLETQMGVSFFAFFYGLFIGKPLKQDKKFN